MGFWHTGYAEFHEVEEPHVWVRPEPKPPSFRCTRCDSTFGSRDDLLVHEFDGHATSRPQLMLHGRECGRSRLAVIAPTAASDWAIKNARSVRVNGITYTEKDARRILARSRSGVVSVVLVGDVSDQDFEFAFNIADDTDLDGVDGGLQALIEGKSLTLNAIDEFIRRTDRFTTGRGYRDSLANYFYGVLARERSTESGLPSDSQTLGYRRRFDEAAAELGRYDRAPAEAISGLVAFHYNHFDLALRKTRSPRIAQLSIRFARLLDGESSIERIAPARDVTSLDYILSDNETEQIIYWTSIPLDGSARVEVAEMEKALSRLQPTDAMKLRVVLAEHYLAAGERRRGERHAAELRHTKELDKWVAQYRRRLGDRSSD